MIKKKEWIPYGRKANSVEINIKDSQNQTINFYKLYKDKTRDIKRIVSKIKEKYGFDFNPEIEEEIKNEKKWLDKDISW